MVEGTREKGGRSVQDDGVVKEAVQGDSPKRQARNRADSARHLRRHDPALRMFVQVVNDAGIALPAADEHTTVALRPGTLRRPQDAAAPYHALLLHQLRFQLCVPPKPRFCLTPPNPFLSPFPASI